MIERFTADAARVALDEDSAVWILIEEGDELVQIARGTCLQSRLSGVEQHIPKGHYQPAIGRLGLQPVDLPLQFSSLLCRARRDEVRSIRFLRAGSETSVLGLCAERDPLILCEARLSLCSRDLDLPIGQVL